MSAPLPPSAGEWWTLFGLFVVMGVIAGAIVLGALVDALIRSRRQKGQPPIISGSEIPGRAKEGALFAIASIILLFGLGIGSYGLTLRYQNPPSVSEALNIDVTAFQWSFRFEYPEYNVTSLGDCVVPEGTDVVFNVTSIDVMHNFGLPDFKIKIDAIPGMYNVLWITTPSLNGGPEADYMIHCYELCGTGHTTMFGNLRVLSSADFNQWLSNQTKPGAGNQTKPGG